MTFICGRFDEGTRLYEDSLAAYRQLGDELGVGILLWRIANSHLAHDDTITARKLAEESGALMRHTRFPKGELVVLGTLGEIELLEGNHDWGLELMRKSIALAEEMGYSWWSGISRARR